MEHSDTLALALAHELPAQLRGAAPTIARAVAAKLSGRQGEPEILSTLADAPGAELAIAGLAARRTTLASALVQFGTNNQVGDVHIRDVAETIYQISVNIALQSDNPAPAPLRAQLDDLLPAQGSLPDLSMGNSNYGPSQPEPGAGQLDRGSEGCVVALLDWGAPSSLSDELAVELGLRGLRVWRPAPHEAAAPERLAAGLASADAALVLLRPVDPAESDRRDAAMAAVWQRYAHPAPFLLLPVLDGLGQVEAEQALGRLGAGLPQLRAIALQPTEPADRAAEAAAVARAALHAVALPRLRAVAEANRPVRIGLFSYTMDAGATDLSLNWAPLFPDRGSYRVAPPEEVWRDRLLPALADVRAVVGASRARRIALGGSFHIAAGYAFGSFFPLTFGTVEVEATPGPAWSTAVAGGEDPLLEVSPPPPRVPRDRRDVSVEVSLTQDVRDDAGDVLEAAGVEPAVRVQLTSRAVLENWPFDRRRTLVASAEHAGLLADQIASEILAQKRAGTIHLFGAIPQALAVLIGARLNTAPPVQCYEYLKDERVYRRVCLLS